MSCIQLGISGAEMITRHLQPAGCSFPTYSHIDQSNPPKIRRALALVVFEPFTRTPANHSTRASCDQPTPTSSRPGSNRAIGGTKHETKTHSRKKTNCRNGQIVGHQPPASRSRKTTNIPHLFPSRYRIRLTRAILAGQMVPRPAVWLPCTGWSSTGPTASGFPRRCHWPEAGVTPGMAPTLLACWFRNVARLA